MSFLKNQFTPLLILILVSACSVLNPDDGDSLTGNWKWIYSQGGFAGMTLTPDSEGYQQQLVFKKDKSFEILRDNESFISGTYTTTLLRSGSKKEIGIEFNFNDNHHSNPWTVLILEIDETLKLMDYCIDCFIHLYERE